MPIFSSFNQITVSGNVGQDPDFNVSSAGLPIEKFSVAVSGWDNKNKAEKTMWMKVVCFGKLAEQSEKWLQKGSGVIVSGYLDENNWTDKEGLPHKTFQIVANSVNIYKSANKGKTQVERQAENPRRDLEDDDPWWNE